MFKDVKSRLNGFLKDWAEREGIRSGNETVLKNYLTHQDIAGLICATRQTVTQLLNDLESEGILAYTRQEIVIKDLQRLKN